MTDRIHTTMHRLQASSGESMTDRPPPHSDLDELGSRHDAVLSLSQVPQH